MEISTGSCESFLSEVLSLEAWMCGAYFTVFSELALVLLIPVRSTSTMLNFITVERGAFA